MADKADHVTFWWTCSCSYVPGYLFEEVFIYVIRRASTVYVDITCMDFPHEVADDNRLVSPMAVMAVIPFVECEGEILPLSIWCLPITVL